ncbi:MAG: site-specific integrase [Glaciecola sp.]|jgi:integrase
MKIKDKLYGYEQRAKNRKGRQLDIRNYVELLISERITSDVIAEKKSVSQEDIEQIFSEIITELQTKYKKFEQYRYARNYLSKTINEGNKEGSWSLPVPSYIHRYRREATLRNASWFKKSSKLNTWVEQWLARLSDDDASKRAANPEEAIGNCLVSACIFGGLCIPEALDSLKKQLLSQKLQKPLVRDKYGFFIELLFSSKSQLSNTIVNDTELTVRRFYPDPLTLGFIATFFSSADNAKICERQSLWSTLSKTLKNVDREIVRHIKTVESLCTASAGVIENRPNCDIDQATIAYSSGKIRSASLPPDVYELISNRALSSVSFDHQKHNSKRSKFDFQQSINVNAGINIEKTISDVRLALATKDEKGHKRTSKLVLASLVQIKEQPLNLNFASLIHWLEEMLTQQKIKVSSASRYWSAIGAPWLAHTSEIDISSFEPEDFEALYKRILDATLSDKNRRYMAGRFDQFHSFLQRHYQLAPLPVPLSDAEGRTNQFVRAYYIPQFAFAEVLSLIDKTIVDKSLQPTLKALFIIAIRSGLRLGELLKLRINDIENSDDSWIFVRDNKFADGKSSSSLRKIPLEVLLLEEEREFIKRYIATRRQIAKNDNILLFSESNTLNIPLNPNFVSTIFAQIATAVTGVKSTFHGLRHSALSNLHLVVEDQLPLLEDLVGYTEDDINRIKHMLGFVCGNTFTRDKYWLLASFAGHATPEITFSNYLHFTDYIASQKFRVAFMSIPKSSIEAALNMTKNSRTRLNKRSAVDAQWYGNIVNWIESKASAYAEDKRKLNKVSTKGLNTANSKTLLFKPAEPTIELCYSVLKCVEDGDPIDVIVTQHNLEKLPLVYNWIKNAKTLQALTTSRGGSRLQSRFTKDQAFTHRLAPQQPESNAELKDANNAITKLRDVYKANKGEIIWAIDYFLHHSNRSNPFIRFYDRDTLDRFVNVIIDVFPATRWEISSKESTRNADFAMDGWFELKEKQGFGIDRPIKDYQREMPLPLALRLRHPDEAKIIEVRQVGTYSARTLGYLFHMLKIML